METKKCSKCNIEKSIDEFGRCRGKPAYRCLKCHREYNKQHKRNKEKDRQSQQRYYLKKKHDPHFRARRCRAEKEKQKRLRLSILIHYGGDPPKCDCCGDSNVEFLTVDHIDGGGNEHRRIIGGSGRLYQWIKNNGFPEGYRILCCNCNHSMGAYGYCPHQGQPKNAT